MKPRLNLFLSKVFISGVALATVTYIRPAVDNVIHNGKIGRDDYKNLAYGVAAVIYSAWVRYASDGEPITFTPKGIPGRNEDTTVVQDEKE